MSGNATLEERVAALESKVEQLLRGARQQKDWRRTLGMFAGDSLMKEINAEGRKIRHADRTATLASLDAEEEA
jgi:hypothetical protein